MKRLERTFFDDFDKLSDWLLDKEDIEVINVQKIKELWFVYYWEIT